MIVCRSCRELGGYLVERGLDAFMATSGAGTEVSTATGLLSESIRKIRRWRPSMVAAIADKWVHQLRSFRP
jgi:hypothetical protein